MKSICIILATFATLGKVYPQQIVRTFRIEKNYINIPISVKSERQKVIFSVGPDISTYSSIRIADTAPDYWVFKDVSRWKGDTIQLHFTKNAKGLDSIYQSNEIAGQDSLYHESLRPQVHFSTKRG